MNLTMKKSPKCTQTQEPTPYEPHHEEKSQMYTDQELTPDESHHEEKVPNAHRPGTNSR